MKKVIKILTAALAAVALTLTCVISAFATDTSDYVSKDKIIEELWGQYWDTNDTDPTKFPESSWNYYIVTGWLDRNYGKYELVDKVLPNSSYCDWSKLSDIKSMYRDFYKNLTKNWDFDDDDGNWYINEYDPETEKVGNRLYHFNFNQGQWSMIDKNGDTVYSFPPKTSYEGKKSNDDGDDFHYDVGQYVADPDTGKLVEKDNNSKVATTNKTASADDKDNSNQTAQENTGDNATQGGARVTGKTKSVPTVTSSDSSSESKATSTADENTKNNTSPILIVVGIIAVSGTVGIVYLKRKKGKN